MVLSLLKTLVAIVVVTVALGLGRTWQEENSRQQQDFLAGTLPSPAPDGVYMGSVPGHTFSWIGKKFDASHERGINVFNDGTGTTTERYPFMTAVGKGVRDTNLDVMKIDYDMPGNPFWLKFILDEIVQVAPGQYLGKMHVRIIPGYPFTLLFFHLRK